MIEELADMERECLECEGSGSELQDWDWGESEDAPGVPVYGRCGTCHGTGRVARFPGLREPCHIVTEANEPWPCINCRGKGYRPRRSLEAVLEAGEQAGYEPHLGGRQHRMRPGEPDIKWDCTMWRDSPDKPAQRWTGTGTSPLEAAARALYRAVLEMERG